MRVDLDSKPSRNRRIQGLTPDGCRLKLSQPRSGERSVAHGVSRGSDSIIDTAAAERRYTGDNDVSPLRGWFDRFASYPMAYAMGYRSAAALRLRMTCCSDPKARSLALGLALSAASQLSLFIPTAESAPARTAAPVPVGSAPGLSHKRTGPPMSCPASGTFRHGLNAPGNNLPIRPAPTTRR